MKALTVLAGDSGRAAAAITAEAAGLEGSRRSGAEACVRYLENKREFLRYDQALDAGWPIATGVIEGACRHLIADRLNLGGCRWGLDGAEAILTVRAVIANGDFEEYWRFHWPASTSGSTPAPSGDSTRSAPDCPPPGPRYRPGPPGISSRTAASPPRPGKSPRGTGVPQTRKDPHLLSVAHCRHETTSFVAS